MLALTSSMPRSCAVPRLCRIRALFAADRLGEKVKPLARHDDRRHTLRIAAPFSLWKLAVALTPGFRRPVTSAGHCVGPQARD